MVGTTPGEALLQRIPNTRVPSYNIRVIVNPTHQIPTKARMASEHDKKRRTHSFPELRTGTVVVLQDGSMDPTKQWRVVEHHSTSRCDRWQEKPTSRARVS